MEYGYLVLESAVKDLRALDRQVAARVRAAIERLAQLGDEAAHQGLQPPFSGTFKLRVGDYRVFYQVDHKNREFRVLAVKHRSEAYRRRR